ncbi:hypothetical protein D3C87_1211010 [compost metagenome]
MMGMVMVIPIYDPHLMQTLLLLERVFMGLNLMVDMAHQVAYILGHTLPLH